MKETENVERRTTYYNMERPAEEEGKGAEAIDGSAGLIDSERLEGVLSEDWVEGSTGRMWWRDGTSRRVLTTSKCMAPKDACLHHCRSPCDRLSGETRW
jgi:hypothetical protein